MRPVRVLYVALMAMVSVSSTYSLTINPSLAKGLISRPLLSLLNRPTLGGLRMLKSLGSGPQKRKSLVQKLTEVTAVAFSLSSGVSADDRVLEIMHKNNDVDTAATASSSEGKGRMPSTALSSAQMLLLPCFSFSTTSTIGFTGLFLASIFFLYERWSLCVAEPNEWLIVIRDGKLHQAGVGLSYRRSYMDTVVRLPAQIYKVQFQAQQVTKEMQGVEVKLISDNICAGFVVFHSELRNTTPDLWLRCVVHFSGRGWSCQSLPVSRRFISHLC
jgi:hypothetical protein